MYRFLSYLVTQSLLRHILALPRPPSGRLPLTSNVWVLVNTPDRFLYIRFYSQSAHNLNPHLNLLDLNSTLNLNIKPQRTETWMHSHLHL
jgi:hypothetical protein